MQNNRKQKVKELGDVLWGIADKLRGAMDADDFKDYMLSFIFLRYLSENYEIAAENLLGADYPTLPENDRSNPLQLWYQQNPTDIEDFERELRFRVHYIIKPQYLWSNIAELARTQSELLLSELSDCFKHIENLSYDNNFQGLFSEINLNSDKLGKTYTERNKKLCSVISSLNAGLDSFTSDRDILGDAYEYLIGKFAAGSGKKAGEFYTPQQISTILSEIVTLDSHNPETGKKEKIAQVLDFTCGSGSLLLNVKNKMGKDKLGRIFGQEKNITTYNLARMNMILHGVKDTEFDIHHGDTLANEWHILNEMNPAKKMEFDAIVANPPFSLKWEPNEIMAQDFRFQNYGLAPKSAADFAFLLHGLHYLSKEGTMAIILPHGVLFRGGVEERIRTKLIQDGYIDTVIGLPANLFFSTGIPVCILVLKKCKRPADILFINAASGFAKDKRLNRLREGENGEPNDIEAIVNAYKFREDKERFSRKVSLEEIEKNGYNLNISRYVSISEDEAIIDLPQVHSELMEAKTNTAAALEKTNAYLKELGLDLL